jgi:BirA family biotin operon repressor/biotin-[acetyl-CoA-carboxylase] ligase
MAAGVLDALAERCAAPQEEDCFREYKRRSMVLGSRIELLSPGREPQEAEVLDIERDYSLRVRLPDGTVRRVNSGEVSIKTKE